MSSLRKAGLGPIVGHTTHKSCRIWIRAEDTHDEATDLSSEHRTIGIAAIVREDGRKLDPGEIEAFYFRLHREMDRTGVYDLGMGTCLSGKEPGGALRADTEYVARAGTLVIDDPFRDDQNVSSDDIASRLPDPNVWVEDLLSLSPKHSRARFKTFPDPDNDERRDVAFLLGSCRYPGLLWKIKEADKIFGPVYREATRGSDGAPDDRGARRSVDFSLMVGDQIYADMLNRNISIGLADTFEEFQERYLTAFGSRNMRKLLRSVPNYMILDDHEIEDNWHQDRIDQNPHARVVFQLAIAAYRSYQWSHGPDTFRGWLYYSFDVGRYPFFVLDTRTRRFLDAVEGSLEDNHLLGPPTHGDDEPGQLERLAGWLEEMQATRGNQPKFIASSSVFAPNPVRARTGRKGGREQMVEWAEGSDSWPAFPATRRAILKTIVGKKIQNVVFLSGDIHCSNVARLRFTGSQAAERLRAYSITSSAFYWPFPFADGEPSNFVHDSRDPKQKDSFKIDGRHSMNYTAWNFTQEDNFCRVDVDPDSHSITVMPFDSDGGLIHKRNWWGRPDPDKPLTSKLDLAKW